MLTHFLIFKQDHRRAQLIKMTPNYQHSKKIRFLHRTAFDFLHHTHEGQTILGKPKTSSSTRWENLMKARMATTIEGVENTGFFISTISALVGDVSGNCETSEVELLTHLRQVCGTVSCWKYPSLDSHDGRFWDGVLGVCFEDIAAEQHCTKYIPHFIQSHKTTISSSYMGYLFLSATLFWDFRPSKSLPLLSWLALQGADLITKQKNRENGTWYRPIELFLSSLINWKVYDDGPSSFPYKNNEHNYHWIQKRVEEHLQVFSPLLDHSTERCVITLSRQKNWTLDFLVLAIDHWRVTDPEEYDVMVSISFSQFLHQTIKAYKVHGPSTQPLE